MRRSTFMPLWCYRAYIRASAWRLRRQLRRDGAAPEDFEQLAAYEQDALTKWRKPRDGWTIKV